MQIEELKNAKQRLEFDWSNKLQAYEIDASARGLNSESDIILWKPGSVRLPPEYLHTKIIIHYIKEKKIVPCYENNRILVNHRHRVGSIL